MITSDIPTALRTSDVDTLEVRGRTDVLHQLGISLCGSRSAGKQGITFAKAVGALAAAHSLPLVSGYARGVDMAGHVACIEAGGHTIAVLAEGLDRFRLRGELKAAIEPWDEIESHITAVSTFNHDASWAVWRAMQRNSVICGLGKVLVTIDPGDKGGTLDAINKGIKRGMPVIIGWSDPEKRHDHLDHFLSRPGVALVSTMDELLAAINGALVTPETMPSVSQPKLL